MRHGLMLVGPAGGGKTCAYRVLQSAMTKLREQEEFEKVHVAVINPKSITMGQLYGEFDENTHEWTGFIMIILKYKKLVYSSFSCENKRIKALYPLVFYKIYASWSVPFTNQMESSLAI